MSTDSSAQDSSPGKSQIEWKSIREWCSFAFAASAFIVSGLAGLLSEFWQMDDLRIIIHEEPVAQYDKTKNEAVLVASSTVVLVNYGTRKLAVTDAWFTFGKKFADVCGGHRIGNDFVGKVLDKGDIAQVDIKPKERKNEPFLKYENDRVLIPGELAEGIHQWVCFHVMIATPSIYIYKAVATEEYQFSKEGRLISIHNDNQRLLTVYQERHIFK
jgi:hypothetical protein